jgi:hypothetical protein
MSILAGLCLQPSHGMFSSAGVERLFSSARDICHYRRGLLNITTIQDLMMLRCISRFDVESEGDDISEESPT